MLAISKDLTLAARPAAMHGAITNIPELADKLIYLSTIINIHMYE
jgi:hypothetical protein